MKKLFFFNPEPNPVSYLQVILDKTKGKWNRNVPGYSYRNQQEQLKLFLKRYGEPKGNTAIKMDAPLVNLWKEIGNSPAPIFTRTQVAQLLNCTPLTIANREKKNIYPEPKRHVSSNHRYYTIQDVFLLQYITFKQINLNSLASLLWDMGYQNSALVLPCLEQEVSIFKQSPIFEVKPTEAVTNG